MLIEHSDVLLIGEETLDRLKVYIMCILYNKD